MQIAWYIVPIAVLGLGVYYVGRRLLGPIRGATRARRALWTALGAWVVAIYGSMLLGRSELGAGSPLAWIAYVSLGLLSFLFTCVLARDLVWGLARGTAWIGRRTTGRRLDDERRAVDESRRAHLRQWTNIGAVGVAGALTSVGIYEARRTPGIVELDVPIASLPPAFDGFRIVQITDVHAGLTVGRDWVEIVAAEVARLRPDLLAFTGDMVDGSVSSLSDAVAPLGELSAPHGRFFVTGNHEYYSGADDWVRHAGRLGYDVLMNEHRLVERGGARLVLAGVTDFTAGQHIASHASDPERALRDAPEDLVRILLAHQPKTIRQTANLKVDLMLAGHTHGGQFFPWNLLTAVDQPYVMGMHRHDGGLVYVSRGTGYWGPPVRLPARSEITVLTLRAAAG